MVENDPSHLLPTPPLPHPPYTHTHTGSECTQTQAAKDGQSSALRWRHITIVLLIYNLCELGVGSDLGLTRDVGPG